MNTEVKEQLDKACIERYETLKTHQTECDNITFIASVYIGLWMDYLFITFNKKTEVFTCDKYN
jgi:hypothetical protein